MNKSRKIALISLLSLSTVTTVLPAAADPARDAILATLAEEAKKADPAFGGFSAERGQAFFAAKHTGGKPTRRHAPRAILRIRQLPVKRGLASA